VRSGELTGEEYEKATQKTVDPSGDGYEEFPEDHSSEISAAEGLKIATELKELGNKAFKAQDFTTALKKYQKGLRYINESADPQDGAPATLAKDINALKFTLHNNSSLMSIKTGDNQGAVNSASLALSIEGATNDQLGKAYYRRALAQGAKKSDDEALKDLEAAIKLVPNDAGVKKEYAAVKQRQIEFKKKEKAAYSKFFA
jgi:peptidyl-prolyl isomerase D